MTVLQRRKRHLSYRSNWRRDRPIISTISEPLIVSQAVADYAEFSSHKPYNHSCKLVRAWDGSGRWQIVYVIGK